MNKKSAEKGQAYAEIMHMFRYSYKDEWAPGTIFDGKSRFWVQAFNELVDQGYIIKKREYPGYRYKWSGVWPEKY